MIAAHIIAMTVGATVAMVAEDQAVTPHVQDLLDRGFHVIAEGQLVRKVECSRFTMKVYPTQTPDSCETKYGSFKRLKGSDGEFVCVSFPDWSCHQSQTLN